MSTINCWTWVRTAINIAMVVFLLMAGYTFAGPVSDRLLAYLLLTVGVAFNVGLHVALWLEADTVRRRRGV